MSHHPGRMGGSHTQHQPKSSDGAGGGQEPVANRSQRNNALDAMKESHFGGSGNG